MPEIPYQSDIIQKLLYKLVKNLTEPGAPSAAVLSAIQNMTPAQKDALAAALASTSLMDFRGVYDAASNAPALTTTGPGALGDTWIVSTAGTLSGPGSFAVQPRDLIVFDHTGRYTRVPAGTAVDGSDLRLGPKGGVAFFAQPAMVGGRYVLPAAPTGDFTALFLVSPQLTGPTVVASENTPAYGGYGIRFDATTSRFGLYLQSNFSMVPGSTVALPSLSGYHWVGVTRVGSLITALYNCVPCGVGITEVPGYPWLSVGVDWNSGGNADAGVLKSFLYFNKGITSAEFIKCAQGDAPAGLARATYSQPGTTYTEIADANNRLTISGQTFTKTAGSEVGALTCFARVMVNYAGGEILVADRYRLTYNLTLTSGNAADLPIPVFGDYSTQVQFPQARLLVGAQSVEFEVGAPGTTGAQYLSLNWGDAYGGTAGATTFSVPSFTLERLGTIASYRPEGVAPSGRWKDDSGNANDLVPGPGVVALNPSAQSRVIEGIITDTLIPGVSSGLNEGSVSVSTIGVTSVRQGDPITLSPDTDYPAGLVLKHVRATANNTVTARFINLNGSSEQTTEIPIKLIQTIN